MNNSKLLILINKEKILKSPINEPNKILLILTFLLSIIETLRSKIKSKQKLRKKILSKYTFILSPNKL